MKSTNNKKSSFSIEGFEKGLMLAGFISPASVSDIQERQKLEKYEKMLKSEKKNMYFKRVVLAAEIAFELHAEPTFGRIKFQKLVYLCEHAAQMDLQNRYLKKAAGPFDNKFMHSIEKEFADQKWFAVEKINDEKMNRSIYKPLSQVENYKPYFQSYFSRQEENINYVVDLFRKEKTDITEIAATLHACLLELKDIGSQFSLSDIFDKFYNWSDKKKRFNPSVVEKVWEWMIEKHLVNNPFLS